MFWRAPTAGLAIVVALSALTVSALIVQKPLTIAEVQGSGSSTPLAGQTVTVEGVVTADLRGDDSYGGVYIQSPEESDIAGASDGIFVAVTEKVDDIADGDLVSVTGEAAEAHGETQIIASSVSLVEPGVGVPVATDLPDGTDPADLESFEGMLVEPVGTYALSSLADLGTTGSIEITDDYGSTFTIDDGYTTPIAGERPFLPADVTPEPGSPFTAPAIPMVLGHSANGYVLLPSEPVDSESNPDLSPSFDGGSFTLGSAPQVQAP